jgi:molecular chaperone IbpA
MTERSFYDSLRANSGFNHNLIGFDQVFRRLQLGEQLYNSRNNYPPYNLEQLDETNFRITMAVAGFHTDEIDITVVDSKLTVKGVTSHELKDYESRAFIHKGLASRNFERVFLLADHVSVTSAGMENGLLTIDLKYEMPEELKPRKIEITQRLKETS